MCDLFSWLKPPTENGTWDKAVMLDVTVFKEFKGLQNTGPEDGFYHFPKAIEKWMEWCYACRSECPPYEYNTQTEVGFNCDDFAICYAAYVRRKELANACWQVWGLCSMVAMTAMGLEPKGEIVQHPILGAATGHAWNVVQCPEGKYEIEPQNGIVWPWGTDPNYKATHIK